MRARVSDVNVYFDLYKATRSQKFPSDTSKAWIKGPRPAHDQAARLAEPFAWALELTSTLASFSWANRARWGERLLKGGFRLWQKIANQDLFSGMRSAC